MGGGCVNINKYSKAIRIALLNEAINSPNLRGPNMMIKALETLGIKRSNSPMMLIWELKILAKLISKMELKFWEAVLNDYVEMQEEINKYKFNTKNAESGITEIRSNYSRKKTEKRILNAGGSISLQLPTFFNENNKVELNKYFIIEHLFDDYGDFPEKKTIEDLLKQA